MKKNNVLNVLVLAGATMSISGCWTSAEEKQKIASVACSVMKETRKMDSAIRVEKVNEVRREIGGEPYLDGDERILLAIELGYCEELILATEQGLREFDTAIQWNVARVINDPTIYKNFLSDYPESKYVEEAKSKILEIEKANLERREFEKISASYDIGELKNYLVTYPDALHVNDIKTRIEKIRKGMSSTTNGLFVQETLLKEIEKNSDSYVPKEFVKVDYNVLTIRLNASWGDSLIEEIIELALNSVKSYNNGLNFNIKVDLNGSPYTGSMGLYFFSSNELKKLFDEAVESVDFDISKIKQINKNTLAPDFHEEVNPRIDDLERTKAYITITIDDID